MTGESTWARSGSRQPVPDNAMKECPSCHTRRGNSRSGWTPITRDGAVVGYTCDACPSWNEPIRREVKANGAIRYLAVVGVPAGGGTRRQAKKRFASLVVAREWVHEMKETAPDPRRVSIDVYSLTVKQLCDRWLDAREAEAAVPGAKIREVSVGGYRSAATWIDMYLGPRLAREITPGDVDAALVSLASIGGAKGKALSHRSITYALLTLRNAYKYGIREGWLTTNPAALAQVPVKPDYGSSTRAKVASGAVLRWTPAQLAAFRAHVDAQPMTEPWIRVGMRLILTGMRRSEVLGVDWAEVDRATGAVGVTASRVRIGPGNQTSIGKPKVQNSERTVQAELIHAGTATALRELWLAQGCPDGGLVIADAAGEPVHPDTFSRRFKMLCSSAGVPRLASIHNIRHSLATALSEAGVPDHEAAALLGHDVQTYRRFYLVTDDNGAASAAAVAGRLFAV